MLGLLLAATITGPIAVPRADLPTRYRGAVACPATLHALVEWHPENWTWHIAVVNTGPDQAELTRFVFAYPNGEYATFIMRDHEAVVDSRVGELFALSGPPGFDDGKDVPKDAKPIGFDIACSQPNPA